MSKAANSQDCNVWCLVEVPAQFKKVTKRVVDVPDSSSVDIPVEYKTITKRVLIKAGGFSEYREVVCSKNMTNQLVRQVQRALELKGYSAGP